MAQKNTRIKDHAWPSMRANQYNNGCSMRGLEFKKDIPIRYYGTDNAVFSTPIIDSQENIFVGSADRKFYAVNPLENSIVWDFKTNGIIDSAAALDGNGNIYVPSGDASLYKLSHSGEKLWEFNLLEKKYRRLSTIYWWEANVAIGPNGLIYAGNDDFYLYAITPDGQLAWSFATGLQIWSVPAFNNGLVYITSFDMCVYALDQNNGRLKWKRRLQNFIASSPAIDVNGDVYAATFDGSIVALDGASGAIRWRVKTKKSIYGSVAIAPDGLIFAASGDGFLYCIKSKTGAILWALPVESPVWSSAVLGLDPENIEPYIIYIGTSAGLIVAITPSGKRRWTYQAKKKLSGRPVGINASLALGKSGLAAGTTDGSIIYMPYDAYRKQARDFNILNNESLTKEYVDVAKNNIAIGGQIMSDVFVGGSSFIIEKMEFTAPEIMNPFDQVGIASLSMEISIIKRDAVSLDIIAFGIQDMGSGSKIHSLQGTPYPRRHRYLFYGTKKGNSYVLEVKNCDFDITAFPVPLDHLLFTFNLGESGASHSFRMVLDCRNLLQKTIKKYWKGILGHIFKNAYLNMLEFGSIIRPALRMYGAFWRIAAGRIWKQWDMINAQRYFEGQGVFSIRPYQHNPHNFIFKEASFDQNKRHIKAVFTLNSAVDHKGRPEILLIAKKRMEPVTLDYKKYFRTIKQGNDIIVTLLIPREVDIAGGIEAVILIDTKIQTSIHF